MVSVIFEGGREKKEGEGKESGFVMLARPNQHESGLVVKST
jgi:hypothetical protein